MANIRDEWKIVSEDFQNQTGVSIYAPGLIAGAIFATSDITPHIFPHTVVGGAESGATSVVVAGACIALAFKAGSRKRKKALKAKESEELGL